MNIVPASKTRVNGNGKAGTSAPAAPEIPELYVRPDGVYPQGPGSRIIAMTTIGAWEYLAYEIVDAATHSNTYVNAVRRDTKTKIIDIRKDGTPQRIILRAPYGKRGGAVIWIGSIDVLAKYCSYEITDDRKLAPAEWSRYYRIRVTDASGAMRERDIPSMDLRQQQSKAKYIDLLDLGSSGNVGDIRNYILSRVDYLGEDDGLSIHGQGPLYLDSGELVFAYRSGAYDVNGLRKDVRAEYPGYYDLTPATEITPDEIKCGIKEFRTALTETPRHPEISAAIIGQLFTAPVAAIRKELWSGLAITGIHGSGKTRLCNRYDAIQSRDKRGRLESVAPVINLGDTTSTVKGNQYAVSGIAGVAITTDDVIKSGDSDARMRLQSEIVSNLTRSFESGGGKRAAVDKERNRVGLGKSPALSTSVRFASELPFIGDSLNERLIRLPHITESWGKGNVFDKAKALQLSAPQSIEFQHRVFSAYVQWMIPRIDSVMNDCYGKALAETSTWEASARIADRYAAIVTGLYMFAAFAKENRAPALGAAIQAAVRDLRACAERQAQSARPPALLFRTALRNAAMAGRASFPGPPRINPDGTEDSSYQEPWISQTIHIDAEDRDSEIRVMPNGVSLAALGLEIKGVSPVILTRVPSGFLIPPRQDKGGKTGSELTRKWLLAMNSNQWNELCRILSPRDGIGFTPNDVINSLEAENVGGRERVYMPKQARAVVIDCEWAFGPNGEDE